MPGSRATAQALIDPTTFVEIGALWADAVCWEQDETLRVKAISGPLLELARMAPSDWVGRYPWDLPLEPIAESGWETYKRHLAAHEPVTDFRFRWRAANDELRFLTISGTPLFDGDQFRGYAGIARDVTQFVRRDRRHRIERDVARAMAGDANPDQLIREVMAAVCSALGWAAGASWDVDSGHSKLTFAQHWCDPQGGADAFIDMFRHISPLSIQPNGLFERAVSSGCPVWVSPLAREPALARLQDHLDSMHTALFLPIVVRGRPRGLFGCFSRDPDTHDPELLQALNRLIVELGEYIARREDHEQLLRFRTAMDTSGDQIFLVDRTTMGFVDMNQTAIDGTGYTREELLALGPQDLLDVDSGEIEQIYDQVIAAGDTGVTQEVLGVDKAGRRAHVEIHRRALRSNGRWLIVSVSRDVESRWRAEMGARRLRRMLAALSATSDAIVRVTSAKALYESVCRAAVDGGGMLAAAVLLPKADGSVEVAAAAGGELAERLRTLGISLDPKSDRYAHLASTAYRTETHAISNNYLRDDRVSRWHDGAGRSGIAAVAALPMMRDRKTYGVLLFYSAERNAFDGEIIALLHRMIDNVSFALGTFEKEAERRLAEDRIQYLATHDALTGLPNRVMFTEILNHAVQSSARHGRRFAVLFIDLDRFKVVNDSFGHAAGDMLLKEMAERLKSQLRTSDVVARLGGDEFVVLLEEVDDPAQASFIARKLLSSVLKPVTILGHDCRVTASIGIAMFPEDGEDEPLLMKNADMAMYSAKKEGKNNCQFYSTELKVQSLQRLKLESNLRSALRNQELRLEYQPQMSLTTGAITGVEALLRWDNPELGSVPPTQFIPVAEETGLIIAIGRWVLTAACEQAVEWQRQGLPPICMAVNLSARQFASSDFLDQIADVLDATGLEPRYLELEITEGMVMEDPQRAVERLSAIKAMGLRLAIDDFGTGYSSLGQIKNFPVDTLKVDRSFIRDLPAYTEDRAITEAIIAMAHTLSLTVIAEGVETNEQVEYLRTRACDQMQGFYLSRPARPEAVAGLLRDSCGSPEPD